MRLRRVASRRNRQSPARPLPALLRLADRRPLDTAMRALFAIAFLLWMLVSSSSINPLFVAFGDQWQTAAMVSGWVMVVVLLIVGFRVDSTRDAG